ncbi:E3 binding domain-containing protein [Deinococcus aerophilus]|uniref:Peripheral subunit-binding (PSBD) domain-containing protein n=1 Tax=Deinococcus aerophilus TaxID=522488 RepID=A0ABQ2GSS2_9DEIO|nr:E3 binding domain-containing protein [Deinococcus aerophilus]GGM10165.1 hypothetical protein GCM10010841_18270 [Deinococcus aerophilus]
MEQIAPLARILAEANGIEWQRLQGSGEGGTIVEQDILNYLTRIMSGEEEPPSTPVDAIPDGWTGDEQLPPGMFSADMLSQAGVDSDIAAFVEQSRPVTPQAAAPDNEALEFELDDADGDDLSAAPAQPEPARFVDEQPGNPTSPDLIAPDHARAPLAAAMPEVVAVPEVAAPEVVAPAPAAPARAPMGLGNLLSQLYRKDKAPEAAPAEVVPAAVIPAAAAPVVTAPELQVAPPVTEPAAPQPVLAEASDVAAEAAEETVEAAPAPSAPEQAEPEASTPEAPEVAEPEGTEPEVIDTYAAEHDQGAADTSAEAAPETPTSEPDAPAGAQPLEAVPHPAAVPTLISVPTPVAAPAGAVWFGTYLRRDAVVGAADDLRTQLSEALDQDVSLAFLVARAAGRHAGLLNLGSVALQGEDGQAQTVQDGALRDAVAVLGGGHAGTPDLLVVDAGALGLDELHYPHTVTLSVGRVRDGAAALTLNGDVDARQAAQFLGRVAEALEKPIALVL